MTTPDDRDAIRDYDDRLPRAPHHSVECLCCDGSGRERTPEGDEIDCPECEGRGEIGMY